MNFREIARFVSSVPFTAFIINPGNAKVEQGYTPLPPSQKLPGGRQYYQADTSLSIRVDDSLLKVDDGKAIDPTAILPQARVTYRGQTTILSKEGGIAPIGDNGAEVIFTTRSIGSNLGGLKIGALNPRKQKELRAKSRKQKSV